MFQGTFWFLWFFNTFNKQNVLNNTTMVIIFNELLRDIFCYIKRNMDIKQSQRNKDLSISYSVFSYFRTKSEPKNITHQHWSLPTHKAYNDLTKISSTNNTIPIAHITFDLYKLFHPQHPPPPQYFIIIHYCMMRQQKKTVLENYWWQISDH